MWQSFFAGANTLPAAAESGAEVTDRLRDFSTDRRVLILSALAAVLGVVSSLVAYGLLWLIAGITNLAFFQRLSTAPALPQQHHLGAVIIIVPVIGALIIGLMARYGSDKIRGHGIPEALEAILLGGSKIAPKVAILKPISAAISIGTGGPFGAEGPIIMTGGAFGSLFAQRFHLSAAERKTLLVAGAAAGMAAVFATPVAAVLLAVELLLFEWKPRSFIPVTVAVIVAAALRGPLMGSGPMFPIATHAAISGKEYLIAALIGLIAGLASGALTTLVYVCEDFFKKLPVHWMWWPAIGAVVVGIGGYFEPRVLGVGYDTIHGLLRGEIIGPVIIGLLVGKAIVWSVALGSGTSGGILAPLLIIGSALGAALAPHLPGGDAGLWALIGMAGMMAGMMNAPLTATVFVVELTRDYNVLPAALLASAVALGVTVLLLRRSILTEKLARRGQHITREYAVDVFELTRVQDVMDRNPPTVPATLTVAELSSRLAQGEPELVRRQGTLLVDPDNRLSGIITRGDIVRALAQPEKCGLTVAEAGCVQLVVTYPDEPLQAALATMLKHNIGRLPVVDREAPRRLLGYLGRTAILSARHRWHEEEEVRQKF